jgi:hypothetical protein
MDFTELVVPQAPAAPFYFSMLENQSTRRGS